MRNGDQGFVPQDLRNIDEVIAALRELVSETAKKNIAFATLILLSYIKLP